MTLNDLIDWLHSADRYVHDASRFRILSKAVELFKVFDKNDNGSLDRTEFNLLVRSLGYTEINCDKEFHNMDHDGNGIISFLEFLTWLNWIPSI